MNAFVPENPKNPIFILEFVEKKELIAVHHTWVKASDNKLYCYWPPASQPHPLLKRKLPKNVEGWFLLEVIYKSSCRKCKKQCFMFYDLIEQNECERV